jgi:hypothetical protein
MIERQAKVIDAKPIGERIPLGAYNAGTPMDREGYRVVA